LMNRVTAIATGGLSATAGIGNFDSSPTLIGVSSSGSSSNGLSVGMLDSSSPHTFTIQNSIIAGDNGSIFNSFSYIVNVAGTQLIGPVSGGTFHCVGTYDGSFTQLSTTCN
jgi:hypothetical protein